jgi:hypothetical protein
MPVSRFSISNRIERTKTYNDLGHSFKPLHEHYVLERLTSKEHQNANENVWGLYAPGIHTQNRNQEDPSREREQTQGRWVGEASVHNGEGWLLTVVNVASFCA